MARTLAPRGRARASYVPTVVTPESWLARKLGRTPDGVHQLLYRPFRCGLTLPQLTALCLDAFHATRALDRLARWEQPIRAAQLGTEAAALTDALVHAVQQLDLAEDGCENDYKLAPTAQHAAAWVRAIDRLMAALARLRSALVRAHHLDQ